jgi:hypothetical protein
MTSDEQIRRGVHRSSWQLEINIGTFIETYNANSKPFR